MPHMGMHGRIGAFIHPIASYSSVLPYDGERETSLSLGFSERFSPLLLLLGHHR
jgi:hypothetical protein